MTNWKFAKSVDENEEFKIEGLNIWNHYWHCVNKKVEVKGPDNGNVYFFKEYQIEGKRDNVKQADKLKLNLYFDPVRRGHDLIDLDIAVKAQAEALEDIKMRQLPLDDDATIGRVYRFYTLEYDADTRILKSYALDILFLL